MNMHFCEQRSEDWHKIRLGIPTASEFDRIVTPTGKLSAQADKYMHSLLAEWMCGHPLENPETRWMERGSDLEDEAVRSYEFETGVQTAVVGFVTSHDGLIGASPDRLVGDDGLLEIKCPSPPVHVGYMLLRSIDRAYFPQVQGQLLICERKWVDIQSYCPGLPTVIMRVERDEKYIALLRSALEEFVRQMLAARADLEKRYGPFHRQAELVRDLANDGYFDVSDAELEDFIREKFPKENHGTTES